MIIATFRARSRARKLSTDRTRKWAFLGTDRQKRLRLTRLFGEAQRFSYAQELHRVMEECRQEFLDRLATIGKSQTSPLYWWATCLASKSPYLSDLFLNFCYFKLLQRWSRTSALNLMVIVDNPAILRALALEPEGDLTLLRATLESLYEWISRVIWKSAALVFAAKMTHWWTLNAYCRLLYKRRWRALQNHTYDVMVYSWIEDRSFADGNARFVDHYLGKLAEFYREKGFSVARVTPVTLPNHLLSKLYRNAEAIIPVSAFITLRDILRITISEPLAAISFGPDNHWFAVLCDGERGRESYASRWYLLYHQAYQRFFNSFVSKLRHAFIYPFENQPWEKMLLLSLRKPRPAFSVIGYQHSTIPQFLLNYHLGKDESEFMPFPDLLVANGALHENFMKSLGYPCEIENGGSLRYRAEKHSANINMDLAPSEKEKKVLVLLGPTKLYALELVDYIIKIAPQSNKQFLLKTHPDLPASRLERWIGPLPPGVSFIEGPLEKYLGQAAYAIHMGTTAALECFRRGMKIIKYLPELIDLDPLDGSKFPQEILTWNLIPAFESEQPQMLPVDKEFFMEPVSENTWVNLVTNR
jgi:hypothetical protein